MQFQEDYVYIIVEPNVNISALELKMNTLVDENVPEHFKSIYDVSLVPLNKIYLSEDTHGELEPTGNKKYITIFLIISNIFTVRQSSSLVKPIVSFLPWTTDKALMQFIFKSKASNFAFTQQLQVFYHNFAIRSEIYT